jgi:hypothetical protein
MWLFGVEDVVKKNIPRDREETRCWPVTTPSGTDKHGISVHARRDQNTPKLPEAGQPSVACGAREGRNAVVRRA